MNTVTNEANHQHLVRSNQSVVFNRVLLFRCNSMRDRCEVFRTTYHRATSNSWAIQSFCMLVLNRSAPSSRFEESRASWVCLFRSRHTRNSVYAIEISKLRLPAPYMQSQSDDRERRGRDSVFACWDATSTLNLTPIFRLPTLYKIQDGAISGMWSECQGDPIFVVLFVPVLPSCASSILSDRTLEKKNFPRRGLSQAHFSRNAKDRRETARLLTEGIPWRDETKRYRSEYRETEGREDDSGKKKKLEDTTRGS